MNGPTHVRVVTLMLAADLVDDVDRIATQRGVTRAEAMCEALAGWIKNPPRHPADARLARAPGATPGGLGGGCRVPSRAAAAEIFAIGEIQELQRG